MELLVSKNLRAGLLREATSCSDLRNPAVCPCLVKPCPLINQPHRSGRDEGENIACKVTIVQQVLKSTLVVRVRVCKRPGLFMLMLLTDFRVLMGR